MFFHKQPESHLSVHGLNNSIFKNFPPQKKKRKQNKKAKKSQHLLAQILQQKPFAGIRSYLAIRYFIGYFFSFQQREEKKNVVIEWMLWIKWNDKKNW